MTDPNDDFEDATPSQMREFMRNAIERLPRREDAYALKTMKRLTGARRMEEAVELGRAIHRFGPDQVKLRRLYAQALIDSGRPTEGVGVLLAIVAELDSSHDDPAQAYELTEALGLLGRAYKQLYIDAKPNIVEPRKADYRRASKYYLHAYQLDPARNHWHGINIVALAFHHARIRRRPRNVPPHGATVLARQILQTLEAKGFKDRDDAAWERASAGEAALAINDEKKAVEHYSRYVEDPTISKFHIGASLRQLTQLWGLHEEDGGVGSKLIPLLKGAAVWKGGDIEVKPKADTIQRYERIFGDSRLVSAEWIRDGLKLTPAVVRIASAPYNSYTIGTGFVLRGELLDADWAGKRVVVTCAHVVSSDLSRQKEVGALDPSAAYAIFEWAQKSSPITNFKCLFTDAGLDITVLELGDAAPHLENDLTVFGNEVRKDQKVNILGYPKGIALSFSIDQNIVLETDTNRFYHRAPTNPGSSGSPVFNDAWQVVGFHSGCKSDESANIGVMISAIRAARRPKPSPQNIDAAPPA